MPQNMWGTTTILFFHDLFTVVWLGGMIALGLGMVPALRRGLGAGPQAQRVVSLFQNRFRWAAYVCVVGLVITGVLLARRSPHFQSLFTWDGTYSMLLSLKHILVILMVLIVIARTTFLAPKVPAGPPVPVRPPAAPVPPAGTPASAATTVAPQAVPAPPAGRARFSMLLLFVNMVLAVGVLFLSAATTVLSSRA